MLNLITKENNKPNKIFFYFLEATIVGYFLCGVISYLGADDVNIGIITLAGAILFGFNASIVLVNSYNIKKLWRNIFLVSHVVLLVIIILETIIDNSEITGDGGLYILFLWMIFSIGCLIFGIIAFIIATRQFIITLRYRTLSFNMQLLNIFLYLSMLVIPILLVMVSII